MLFTIFTLGCKVNTYESDAVRELFLKEKWREAKVGETPDLVIVNTCTVTGMAAKKSRQHIRKFRNAHPRALIAVMGCYSQQEGAAVVAECGADLVLGTSKRNEILNYVNEALMRRVPRVEIDAEPRHFAYEEIATLFQPMTSRAFVKVQDGCDNFCSYCVIPYVRGKSRSRKPQDVIKEIKALIDNGYREIVITGIHTGGYGKDLPNYSFSRLIREIIEATPNLYRLRISSIEATEIDDDFIALLAAHDNIAHHLHIPLQSGSEGVLRRMNRRYHLEDYMRTIEKIRAAQPLIALTTDVIVGFPGETEEEFQETYDFIEAMAFSELHVFPFSHREHTVAASLPNQVDDAIKKQRGERLLRLSDRLHEKYQALFKGRVLEVIFEDYDAMSKTYRGHASNYLEVRVQSPIDVAGKVFSVAYRGPDESAINSEVF
ncbi:MAG: tRNA (N(6)-L-threonylcarbamoyladenosine(37)-C(2))-methylthiotransferase MtaB [Bacilli bacterium]|jgi:threonylcarbamoyladenosine tRNA methylthiotransferase MtaB